MIFASLEFAFVMFAFLYLVFEEGLWAKDYWLIISIFFVDFVYFIFIFFRNLWKKSHLKNHIYVDCGPEGMCIDARPSLVNGRPVFYRWEEIEYVNFYADKLECFLLVKPYKRRKALYKFNYWRSEFTYFWGFRKAILELSGRKDTIKKKHPRPFE